MNLNIHPADELAAVREEIKILEEREKVLRDALVNGSDADRDGKQYRPFLKKSDVKSLKLSKKEVADA